MSSENTTPNATETTSTPAADGQQSIVDAVFDAALAWADHGLSLAKQALEGSARAMDRTAKSLDAVRKTLEHGEHKPAA